MQKLNRFQTWFMLITAVIIMTISNEVSFEGNNPEDNNPQGMAIFQILLPIVLSLTGAAIAEKLSQYLFKYMWVRKTIMGSKFVEGHWILKTTPHKDEQDNSSPLLYPAVAHMSYDHTSQEFRVETTRISHDGKRFTTLSEVAHVRTTGPTIRYLNFFKLSGPHYDPRYGFSSGKFIQKHQYAKMPINFDADISVQEEGNMRRQFGRRISDREAGKFYKKFGHDWVEEYLKKLASCEYKSDDP